MAPEYVEFNNDLFKQWEEVQEGGVVLEGNESNQDNILDYYKYPSAPLPLNPLR